MFLRKKLSLTILFFLFIIFYPALALGVDCNDTSQDKIMAKFVAIKDLKFHEIDDDDNYDPLPLSEDNYFEFCVPIENGNPYVSFSKLKNSSDILGSSLANSSVYLEWRASKWLKANCQLANLDNSYCESLGNNMVYLLSRELDGKRLRYRFGSTSDADLYLYFMKEVLYGYDFEEGVMDWEIEKDLQEIKAGDQGKLEVSVNLVSGSGGIDIDCVGCEGVFNFTSNNNKIEIDIDTVKYLKVKQVKTPVDIIIKLLGKTKDKKIGVYNHKIRLLPFDCAGLMKGVNADNQSNVCLQNAFCFYYSGECLAKDDKNICKKLPQEMCGTDDGSLVCKWHEEYDCIDPLSYGITEEYGVPEGYDGVIPGCAFSGMCDDTNQLLLLIINFGKMILKIVGSLAFVMFVYGGFTIILSLGSAEKVKKGQGILVAAVVGLLLALAAYVAVDFLLDAVKVTDDFRGITR